MKDKPLALLVSLDIIACKIPMIPLNIHVPVGTTVYQAPKSLMSSLVRMAHITKTKTRFQVRRVPFVQVECFVTD